MRHTHITYIQRTERAGHWQPGAGGRCESSQEAGSACWPLRQGALVDPGGRERLLTQEAGEFAALPLHGPWSCILTSRQGATQRTADESPTPRVAKQSFSSWGLLLVINTNNRLAAPMKRLNIIYSQRHRNRPASRHSPHLGTWLGWTTLAANDHSIYMLAHKQYIHRVHTLIHICIYKYIHTDRQTVLTSIHTGHQGYH